LELWMMFRMIDGLEKMVLEQSGVIMNLLMVDNIHLY